MVAGGGGGGGLLSLLPNRGYTCMSAESDFGAIEHSKLDYKFHRQETLHGLRIRRLILSVIEKAINTLKPTQNGHHFPDDIFKGVFLNENVWISIKISLKFISKNPVSSIHALIQIIAASHCLKQWWLVGWCIQASVSLNELSPSLIPAWISHYIHYPNIRILK